MLMSHLQESFCRDDYLLVSSGATSVSTSNNTRVLSSVVGSSGTLELADKKVTRHELFRFEANDSANEQWVIRTWDGSHVAVDQDGNLTAKVISSPGIFSIHDIFIV